MEGTKIFLKKKNTKSSNMLMSDMEIFLKKRKERSVNVVVHLLEDKYRTIFSRMQETKTI